LFCFNIIWPVCCRPYPDLPELKCVRSADQFGCMHMISENEADLMQLDPGMGYTAGEYYTMMPLMAERYTTGE
jgi:melanoma-associated antigen p97